MISYWGVEHGSEVSKADAPSASAGRKATATVAGPWHSAIAAKKGKKLRSTGRSLAYNSAGSLPGLGIAVAGAMSRNPAMARAGTPVAYVGAGVGNNKAFHANNKRGYYKPKR